MRKKKENSHQSPNFILVKIFYRAQNLFEKLVVSDKIVSNELLTEYFCSYAG